MSLAHDRAVSPRGFESSDHPELSGLAEIRATLPIWQRRAPYAAPQNSIFCEPETPIRHFTAGAFAAMHDTAAQLVPGQSAEEREIFLSVCKIFLSYNCDHEKMAGLSDWRVVELHAADGAAHKALIAQNGLLLDPWRAVAADGQQHSEFGVGLGKLPGCEVTPGSECEAHRIEEPLRELIEGAISRASSANGYRLTLPQSGDGHSEELLRLARGIMAGLWSSPTAQRIELLGRARFPGRFDFIDTLHEARTDSKAVSQTIAYLEQLPVLAITPGWCGGLVLHDSAQYGISGLVDWVLERAKDGIVWETAQGPQTRYLRDILSHRDRDGATPLHRAGQSAYWEIAERLLELGADPFIGDRYGTTYGDYRAASR